MYPCDRKVLEQLLNHIDRGELEIALKTWSEHRRNNSDSCTTCPYETVQQDSDCCMCLEGKLRTLSLYHHEEGGFETSLLNAARKLNAFSQQNRSVA